MIADFRKGSVSLSGIDKAPSRRVTYKASVSSIVLDVHVKQHEMHMSCCPTCTCCTALHVHLKQDYSPGKGTFLSKKNKVQHRTRGSIPSMDTSATEKIGP